ncbi:chemoreceptor-like protein with four helix bundle sensory module [Larkinella arboricola]|uniref:Chemoreceptor-like protein with four helix bundle sensory module n=1 Tax=Larkinella arboricola TaxID=643671 RepID=A0A327WVC5_LARAB|nr:MCP four helix bundle domain-containing protein [Larkinella arboricola]RAJ93060.1 chemoreceptor-like protein with four helix bundle sensory module [Larkinella arboricola]
MKPSAINRSRLRLTLLVVSLLCFILISIFLSRRSVHQLRGASASIYQDRLVPTAMIAQLTAQVYQKRLLLEAYGREKTKPALLESRLDGINRQADSLLTAFDQTKLTPQETDELKRLRKRLAVYNELEKAFISKLNDRSNAQEILFVGAGATAFNQLAQTLAELSALQLRVGEELLNESSGQTNYLYVLTALQIGLVLVIGVCLFWHRF